MANYSKQTLVRIGRLLNTGRTGHLRKLAEFAGVRTKAMYNWTVEEADPQYRQMPPSAKRMVAMLAYFGAAGLITEERMKDIMALEAVLDDERESLAVLRRIRNAGQLRAPAPSAAEPGVPAAL